jgi:hypothetical protein
LRALGTAPNEATPRKGYREVVAMALWDRAKRKWNIAVVSSMMKEKGAMRHLLKSVPLFALGVLLAAAQPAAAQLLFEDFETYNLGALDKNLPGGPNMAPNGSGNPWFGPSPPNCQVVLAEGDVVPPSGMQMVRGTAPMDFDQNWYNLAYRLNGGLPFQENIMLAWYFYDPLGPGGTEFKDYIALAFYDNAPPDTDGPADYNLNHGFTRIQRLSLGATTNDGSNANFYQARVAGATDGYNDAGWFNTTTPRSRGWHQGAIVIGPMQADGTNDVSFYIDDLVNPVLVHNSVTNYGYNIIEINVNFGLESGYFDAITFDLTQ